MKKTASNSNENPVWAFLSSVRLAVFLLIILALTSIAGTVLPQGQSLQFYLEKFGPNFFRVIKIFHLYDTYHSWWYLFFLTFFCLNLIVCTIKRLPITRKLVGKDNLAVGADRLIRMPFHEKWTLKGRPDEAATSRIVSAFQNSVGRTRQRDGADGGTLYLAEQGKWSYWGLYGLHASILVIFVGALTGTFFGFKGQLMLLEGESADHIMVRQGAQSLPLGFTIRCDKFDVQFYDNGAPKEFRSDLAILQGGREVYNKSIEVNDPLRFDGITFYQSSYQAVPEAQIRIVGADGEQGTLTVPAYEEVPWPPGHLSLGIMQYMPNVHGNPAVRVWVGGMAQGPPQAYWVLKGQDKEFQNGNKLYKMTLLGVKERYMTGLQVKKDPGVWVVWLGCAGLIFGFIVVFWVAHRRRWLWIGELQGKTTVILAGQTNKNRFQFDKDFGDVKTAVTQSLGDQI